MIISFGNYFVPVNSCQGISLLLLICSPFQVADIIVHSISVYMINSWLVFWIWEVCLSYKPMSF